MSKFHIEHHQIIESALKNFNADFFSQNNIYFGGGTRIALEIDEFRESVDIDFLCPTRDSYRAVREQVTNVSLGNLVHEEFRYAREIRADRDAVRTVIDVDGTNIKLEFVSFNEYNLSQEPQSIFHVPSLSRESCFVTKLLANTDRALKYPYKDIFDLLAMCRVWGDIPQKAWNISYEFYSEKVVRRELVAALEHMVEKPSDHRKAAKDMLMKTDWANALIDEEAPKLLQKLKG
ncbi:nucleotidyl transferase AbiEii/AbiGii toxin family protein [Shewanella algae]|uniref:nucleotidyl transferase AbiEii/AbiGii toxin family protein n=1 Tax=Shewanella algae TaxID=38313 RepID=UPI001AADF0E7|nr:nucleotidyl transferase AbiEii/AbiGii toxin family protein [Shewanella algae]MBO2670013.1 nucleotidyl transferase AbiEii/AbiGii toxin family protein [Shewanella algae]